MPQDQATEQQPQKSQAHIDEVFRSLRLETPEDRARIVAPVELPRQAAESFYYAINVSGSADEAVACYEATVNA